MRKPSISKADALLLIHRFMHQGSSYVNARIEIHEQFDVIEPVVDDGAYIYLANGNEGLRAYTFGIDNGKPGSDRTVCAVMAGDGRVLGRHSTKESAAKHIRAIIAGEISEEPLDDSGDVSRFDLIDIDIE